MLKPVVVEMEPGLRKENETHFGYKLHQETDIDYCLIREIETTTASLHDSQVDLSTEGVKLCSEIGVILRCDDEEI